MALTLLGGKIHVGIRVVCASQPYALEPVARTRPRLVLELFSALRFEGQLWTTGTPWYPSAAETLNLKALLENPVRHGPVFILTEPDESRLGGLKVKPFLLDAERLALKVQGLATVVCLDKATSWRWTDLVGRPWFTYRGAVRTFLPGLSFDEDSPYTHPLARAERVLAFTYDDKIAEDAFESFLVDQAYRVAAERTLNWSPCVFFSDARTLEAERQRQQAGDEANWKSLYENEVSALREQCEQLEDQAERYNDDALAEARWRREVEFENRRLRARIDALSRALESRTGLSVDNAIPIPDDLAELPEWADQYLAGRLVLHPRALRGVKDVARGFTETRRTFQALLLLAGAYRSAKRGETGGAKDALDTALAELELECSPAFTPASLGRSREQYELKYPLGSDRTRTLDLHLKKGNSFDPRFSLRVYFFWDEETEQVVVGWLPGHLDNMHT